MVLEEPQLVKMRLDFRDNLTLIPHSRDEETEPKEMMGYPRTSYHIKTTI